MTTLGLLLLTLLLAPLFTGCATHRRLNRRLRIAVLPDCG